MATKSLADEPSFVDPNRRYPVDQGFRLLGVSRSHGYSKIARGELRVIRDGRRVFIPGTEIVRLSTLPNSDRGTQASE